MTVLGRGLVLQPAEREREKREREREREREISRYRCATCITLRLWCPANRMYPVTFSIKVGRRRSNLTFLLYEKDEGQMV